MQLIQLFGDVSAESASSSQLWHEHILHTTGNPCDGGTDQVTHVMVAPPLRLLTHFTLAAIGQDWWAAMANGASSRDVGQQAL